MSNTFRNIRNNTNNTIIVSGVVISPNSTVALSNEIISGIDKQYFSSGLLVDLGVIQIGENNVVIEANLPYYKKPPTGIPKKDLEKTIVSALEKAIRSVQKGQITLDDLNPTLKEIILSNSNDKDGNGLSDNHLGTLGMAGFQFNSGVIISEEQLENKVKSALALARTAYQLPEDGIGLEGFDEEVRHALTTLIDKYDYWKDPVETIDDLPTLGNTSGDVRFVISTKEIWAWDEESNNWGRISVGDGSGTQPGDKSNPPFSNPLLTSDIVGEFFAEQDQRIFVFQYPYPLGTNNLQVFLNGILMVKDDDYIEVDKHTIEFLYPLDEDSYVLAALTTANGSAVVIVDQIEINPISNKRLIRLNHTYKKGVDSLKVYLNGILVGNGSTDDYTEVDDIHINFNYDLESGDKIIVRIDSSTLTTNVFTSLSTIQKAYNQLAKKFEMLEDEVKELYGNR